MNWLTHITFSLLLLLISANIANKLGLVILPIFIITGMIASLIPDIDHTSSYLGKKIKPLAWILKTAFKHRGFTHSIPFALIIAILIAQLSIQAALGFFIGYLSHLLIDGLTPGGVRILWPLKFKIKGSIKTFSIGDYTLTFLFTALNIALFLFYM